MTATHWLVIVLFVCVSAGVFACDLAWHRRRTRDVQSGKAKQWPAP